MDTNAVMTVLGRRLRLAVIGGGPGSFIVAALDGAFDVIADKPMTNTFDEALELLDRVRTTGLVFCLTHNYTGYPMVRQARAMVQTGEVGAIVPGRLVDDYVGALLRSANGARGSFWITQAAAGVENCLRIRVSGTKGSLEWMQEQPTTLSFKPLDAPAEIRTPNGPGTLLTPIRDWWLDLCGRTTTASARPRTRLRSSRSRTRPSR